VARGTKMGEALLGRSYPKIKEYNKPGFFKDVHYENIKRGP
jgi:hypothetical protein